MNENNKKELLKGIIFLLIIVIGFTIAIKNFSHGENLYDYADKNNIPVHGEQINTESEKTISE